MRESGAKRASINIFLLVRGVMGVLGRSLAGLPCETGSWGERERSGGRGGGRVQRGINITLASYRCTCIYIHV